MFRSSVVSIGLRSYLTKNTVLPIIENSHINARLHAKWLLLYSRSWVPNAILRYELLCPMRKDTGPKDTLLQVTVDFRDCESE